jgi:3-keto steroid reductase
MSSLTALARHYDPDDWQLVKSANAYEASKYQLELLVTQLERVSVACHNPEMPPRITHIIVDPGVTNTRFSEKLRNCFTTILQILLFYFVCQRNALTVLVFVT